MSHIIFMNLDEYLQPSTLNKSNVTSVASIIYSIQVGDRSLVNNKPSVFRSNPLILEFTFDQVRCDKASVLPYIFLDSSKIYNNIVEMVVVVFILGWT